ncbi:MAG: GTPase HflX [Microgenomates group bacterium]
MEKKAFFVMVIGPHDHVDEQKNNFWEEEVLLNSLGYKIIKKFFQHRVNIDSSTYIGSGKLQEIKNEALIEKPDLIYLNDVLNPAIIFRVEQSFWEVDENINVWDRVDLILNIFQKHATSVEAKLQIELARLKHLGPRIYGLGRQLSQQYGAIGVRGGFGETLLEKMKRYIKLRIRAIENRLQQIEEKKNYQIKQRKEKKLFTISLVGYTNTGKTTLFNLLTKKEKLVADQPFSTLETVTGKIRKLNSSILVSDTIGFIENLPLFLIDAFKTTLMETASADLIFHLIDSSDKNWLNKLSSVNSILDQLKIDENKVILVLNKIDKVRENDLLIAKRQFSDKIFFISAKTGEGVNRLISFINEYFSNNYSFNN